MLSQWQKNAIAAFGYLAIKLAIKECYFEISNYDIKTGYNHKLMIKILGIICWLNKGQRELEINWTRGTGGPGGRIW